MGNVLVFFSHQRMCENVARVCAASVADTKQLLIDSGLQNKIECGRITEQQFHAAFETYFGRTIDFEQLKLAAADIFERNDSIIPLLDELKARQIRLVLLSNTSITHLEFIGQEFDVLDRFDDFTTSFAAGAQKPDAPIYEDALARAHCDPQECFYTDDIEAYVTAARAYGIQAEVYTTTASTRAALRPLGVDLPAT